MSQSKIKKLRKQQALKRIGVERVVGNEIRLIGIRQILKENWKFLLILCLGIFLLYFNSLWGDFVSDDYASITQNPGILNARHMFTNFNFVSISTYLIAKVFGISSPVPYHLFSLSMYLLNCLAAFVFVYLLFDERIAQLTLLIFSVLPIHTETVSWISGKPYLIVSLFVLISLNFMILYLKTRKSRYLAFMIISFLCSFMGDKTRALAFVFMGIWYLLLFNQKLRKPVNLIKVFLAGGGVVMITGLIFWPLIKDRIFSVNFGYRGDGSIFYNPFFQYPTAVTKYLQMLFLPMDLTLYHTMYTLPVWLNWLTLLSYVACVVYFWFKDRNLSFALGLIFMATAPSMAPIKVSWLVAERYVFLGSLGWCLFLAFLWQRYLGENRYFKVIILVFLVGFYSLKVFVRNIDWQTNHNLWVATVQVSPNSHNAWNNIGDDYDKLGQYENAIKGFTQSTVVKPNYADAFHNRANIYFKTGRLDLARDSYETALRFNPDLMQTYISLVQIDLNEDKLDLALEHSGKAVEIDPGNPQAWYVIGIVYARTGQRDKAKDAFNKSLQIAPGFKPSSDALTELSNIKSNGRKIN